MNKRELFKKLEKTNDEISDRELDGLSDDDLKKRKEKLLAKFNKPIKRKTKSIYGNGECNHSVLQACPDCYDNCE